MAQFFIKIMDYKTYMLVAAFCFVPMLLIGIVLAWLRWRPHGSSRR
jgi:hypothetical protein